MLYLIFHCLYIFGSLCGILIPSGRPIFGIKNSDLLFKTYMIKPNSWIHFLFLKKNRYKNFLHIKQNAVIILNFWIYFIFNSVICSLIVYFDIIELSCMSLKIIAGILMVIYLFIVIIVNCILSKQSNILFKKEMEMSQKEYDDLIKEIERLVPHFYDSLPNFLNKK